MVAQTGWAIHIPIIPATPAKTLGAGNGNFKDMHISPKAKPTDSDRVISFIILFYLLEAVFLILYMLLKYFS